MKKEELKKLIDTAAGRIPADTGSECFFRKDPEGRYRSLRR